MLAPQVLDGELKSAALVPLKVTLLPGNEIAVEVLFASVTVCAALVAPTAWFPKFRLVGETPSVGSSVSLATKASDAPFKFGWNAPAGNTGKLLDVDEV